MTEQTITKKNINEVLAEKLSTSQENAMKITNAIFTEMCDALVNDGELKLSSFGTFSILQKKERHISSLKTHDKMQITARKVVSFKASKTLKNEVEKSE